MDNNVTLRGIGVGGTPGEGVVLLVESINDFHKVKGGEVLVVRNATPDFIVILKKISCLITDQGGATCHIAIVCRELQASAIVATSVATKMLKDGDRVWFDPVGGVIKVVAHANG